MRRLLYSLTVLGTFYLSATPVQGQGILFVQKETRGQQSTTNNIQIEGNKIRVESRSSGDESAFVFDGATQTARMINITKKTYTETTKAELDQTSSQLAQMQEQLRNVPPAQRAIVEQMMQSRGLPGTAAAAPKVEYKQAGTDRVGQWTCTKYEGTVGGQKTTEVCTVDPQQLGLTAADFEPARQLSEFMKSLTTQTQEATFGNGTAQNEGYTGVTVRRTTFRNGTIESVTEVTETRRQVFPATTFEVPTGFNRVTPTPVDRGERGERGARGVRGR